MLLTVADEFLIAVFLTIRLECNCADICGETGLVGLQQQNRNRVQQRKSIRLIAAERSAVRAMF